jgi:hypothetical protein
MDRLDYLGYRKQPGSGGGDADMQRLQPTLLLSRRAIVEENGLVLCGCVPLGADGIPTSPGLGQLHAPWR